MSLEMKCALVCGNGNRQLALRVAEELKLPLSPCMVVQRKCGEVLVQVDPSLRGCDVYVIQPTCNAENVDINVSVMELLFLIRRLKLEGAARITALVPFFAYARQDRKTDLRCPISAAAVSQLIVKMGVDRVVTLDLHSGQIQGCFNGRAPLDNLQMALEFAQYIRTCRWFASETTVIVSPDAGGVARAHAFADLLGVSHIVTVMKRRAKAGVVESMQTVGDVKGYSCIILDDMCDTGGTLVAACKLLKDMGASRVIACITHGILTDPCSERVNNCAALDELVVSDSLPQEHNLQKCSKLKVLSIAALLAQAIVTYNTESSISELFMRPATPHASPRTNGPKAISPISGVATPYPEFSSSGTATPKPHNAGNERFPTTPKGSQGGTETPIM